MFLVVWKMWRKAPWYLEANISTLNGLRINSAALLAGPGPIWVKLLQKNMTRPFFNRNLNWLHTPQDFHGMIYILGTPWFWGLATSQVLISNFCIPWCRMGHVPYNPMNIKVRKIALKCHAYLLKVVYCRYFWKYMPMDDIELLVSFWVLSVRCVLSHTTPCTGMWQTLLY